MEALVLAASLPLRRTTLQGVLDFLSLGVLSNEVSSTMHTYASNCANRDWALDTGDAALSAPGWPTRVGVEMAA